MKRVLTILAILSLPLSVWAMTPINDSALSNVTGQAGVNINANLTMDISIGTMAWGDADGLASVYNPWDDNGTGSNYNDAGGYVGITGFNITNLVIKARTTDSWNGYTTLMLKPITIDVATSTSAINVVTTASNGPADAFHGGAVTESIGAGLTFVRFGLGALVISLDGLQFDVSLGERTASTGATAGAYTVVLDQNLGQVSLGGMKMAINPWSYVDIYQSQTSPTAATSGVAFAVNVTLDHFSLEYMSWGDKDGMDVGNFDGTNAGDVAWFGTNTDAGYIGLNEFLINGPIAINGTVAIDIATIRSGAYAQVPPFTAFLCSNGANLNKQLGFLQWLVGAAASTSLNVFGPANAGATLLAYQNVIAAATTKYYPEMAAAIAAGATPAQAGQMAFDKYTKTDGEGTTMLALLDSARAFGGDIYSGAAAAYGLTPTTVVHIAFPTNFIIDVRGSITGNVVLAAASNLASTTGTGAVSAKSLGDIYIQGMTVNMHAGSWVDIWAH